MNTILNNYINTYGGKAGVLQFLRDFAPELGQYLAPQQIIPYSKTISTDIYNNLIASIQQNGHNHAILRASHPKDRFGLVDFLPTFIIEHEDSRRHREDYNMFVDDVSYKITHGIMQKHQPHTKELHRILSPYISHTLYTITEHPNQKNHLFVDTGSMGTYYGRYTRDAIDKQLCNPLGGGDTKVAQEILSLIQRTRSLDIFDTNDALQYEIGHAKNGSLYIFQIRKFSNRFPKLPEELVEHNMWYGTRIMGMLPSSGEILWHEHGTNLGEMQQAIDFEEPNTVFSCTLCSEKIDLESNPKHLRGFICENQSALFHNLTGPTQAVLQNNGFALLNASIPYGYQISINIKDNRIKRDSIR